MTIHEKTSSWSNSEFRHRIDVCDLFVKYMDAASDSRENRFVLRLFSEAADTYSFETASRAFSKMANRRAYMTKAGNVAASCRCNHRRNCSLRPSHKDGEQGQEA